MTDDVEWTDGPVTEYYQGWYQIADADPVRVGQNQSGSNAEKRAKENAESALEVQLKVLVGMGIKIRATYWTTRIEQKTVTRITKRDASELMVTPWFGQLMVVNAHTWEASTQNPANQDQDL